MARAHTAAAAAILLLCCCMAAEPARAQASSPSYVLKQSTANSGGDTSTSGSYRLTGSAGQESTVGTSSSQSASYVLQSGFWSYLGSGLVPVVLTVSRNPTNPGNLDLRWSGNNPPYTVYRSDDCRNVLASELESTSANESNDIPPLAAPLECMNVLATAPGPAPPPGP